MEKVKCYRSLINIIWIKNTKIQYGNMTKYLGVFLIFWCHLVIWNVSFAFFLNFFNTKTIHHRHVCLWFIEVGLMFVNHIGGKMVSVFASSVCSSPDRVKQDYKIDIFCFSAIKHTTLKQQRLVGSESE